MRLCCGIIFCITNVNYLKICAVGIGGFDRLGVSSWLLERVC